jgi:hypothetical protein
MFRRLQLRFTYYAGKVWAAIGYCWHCGHRLNFTRNGRGICPDCKKRY